MAWRTISSEKEITETDATTVRRYEEARDESLPVIAREPPHKAFAPIRFQPVESPGNYEAEFAQVGDDIVFHFWPHGYHSRDVDGRSVPRFQPSFLATLRSVMTEEVRPLQPHISEDPDVGAVFVKIPGLGENTFHRELCIKACKSLHTAMGGTG